jgi:hypothetical protein
VDWTAVVGIVTTGCVGMADYVFGARTASAEREAGHELAEGQREHELRLRRGERADEARRDTYVDLLRSSLVLAERAGERHSQRGRSRPRRS